MRSRAWLLAAVVVTAAHVSPLQEEVSAQAAPGVVISEFRFRGPAGASDEFIELYNAGPQPVNVGGWTIRASSNTSTATALRATLPGVDIKAGCFFLLTNFNNGLAGGYSGAVAGDAIFNTGFADEGGIALLNTAGAFVDRVGAGTLAGGYGEGTRLTPLTNVNFSYERRPGGDAGHGIDTNNNVADFQAISPATPRNSDAQFCVTAKVLLTHEVQGAGAMSPVAGHSVTVRGVVTARTSDGFFMQTETGAEDADANTSEGLFVAHVSAAAHVGRIVHVDGTVAEHVAAPGDAPVTQLRSVTAMSDVGAAAVPAAVTLTGAELSATGTADQLERFEGMRVTAALTAVSPAAVDGSFFAVLSGAARTFREPAPFDGNPERLRVDADGVAGTAAVNLSTGAMLTDVTGPLDFAANAYTLLPEAALLPSGGMMMSAVAAAPATQFSLASLNLGAPAADAAAHEVRLAKASLMARAMLNVPDVIAVQQGDAALLGELAARIDADASAAGQPAPGYSAQLDGFLVRASRVAVLSAEHVGSAVPHPADPAAALFSRAPVMLRASINRGALVLPQQVTVINSQLDSPADTARHQAQADWLAAFVQGRQLNDPNEAIVLAGGFNAHAFDDGVVDTVRMLIESAEPDLVDLTASVADAQRYSSIAAGNAQALDHVLATANLAAQFHGAAYARVNADFPEALQSIAGNPGRLSDRDPAVVLFAFPPDVTPPVFAAMQDLAAEATGPDGAAVAYAAPAATDNLDASVLVQCSPSSGSLFPLGNTGVTCSAADAAGNASAVSFTVSIADTTAPAIAVPADIDVEATSADGRVIAFAVSAIDTVSGPVGVTCVPASGSTFPIGTTAVECSAADAAGNGAQAHFSVTVSRPVPGRMHGGGTVGSALQRVAFTFEVGESAAFHERGWVMLLSKDGSSRPRTFAAVVSEVSFSSADGSVTFSGAGYWNGLPNYRFEIAASDRGEPGAGRDTLALTITSPAGIVVESVAGVLRSGNVQSLR